MHESFLRKMISHAASVRRFDQLVASHVSRTCVFPFKFTVSFSFPPPFRCAFEKKSEFPMNSISELRARCRVKLHWWRNNLGDAYPETFPGLDRLTRRERGGIGSRAITAGVADGNACVRVNAFKYIYHYTVYNFLYYHNQRTNERVRFNL